MKKDQFGNLVVESTDKYYYEVGCRWVSVPSFWVNSAARNFEHKIMSITGIIKN